MSDDKQPPDASIFKADETHERVARDYETTCVRMMMAADQSDHVHPMMKGSLRAAATMALQFIKDPDATPEALAWLVNDIENDCRDIVRVLRGALKARGVPDGVVKN